MSELKLPSKGVAILVDPGRPAGLSAVLEDLPVPMMPVGTKPLVQHWVERCVNAGIQDIVVLLNHLPEKTRAFLGDGQRWGVNLRTLLYRDEQALAAQWPLVADICADGLFCAEINAWLDPEIENALREHLQSAGVIATTGMGDRWLRAMLSYDQCTWSGASVVELDSAHTVSLSTVKEYWQLNMDLLTSTRSDPLPNGFEAQPGVWIASNCRISDSTAFIGASFLGESSIVSKRVGVGPDVVIADHVVLEEGAQVQRAVLFPKTFVGSHIVLEDVVVAGDVLYRVKDDVVLHVNDLEIIARRESLQQSVSLQQRVVALLLLILLCLPMLAGMLVSRFRGGRGLVSEEFFAEAGRSLEGRREYRSIEVVSLDFRHPVWRKLPWLFKTLRGELPLVGSSLRPSVGIEYPAWVSDAEIFVPGVITLADATAVDVADSEATIVADVYQLSQGKRGLSLKLTLQWLLRLIN